MSPHDQRKIEQLEAEIKRLKEEINRWRRDHKGSSCEAAKSYEDFHEPQYGDWD